MTQQAAEFSVYLLAIRTLLPDYWQVFVSGFHAINTSDQEARLLYALILHRPIDC